MPLDLSSDPAGSASDYLPVSPVPDAAQSRRNNAATNRCPPARARGTAPSAQGGPRRSRARPARVPIRRPSGRPARGRRSVTAGRRRENRIRGASRRPCFSHARDAGTGLRASILGRSTPRGASPPGVRLPPGPVPREKLLFTEAYAADGATNAAPPPHRVERRPIEVIGTTVSRRRERSGGASPGHHACPKMTSQLSGSRPSSDRKRS